MKLNKDSLKLLFILSNYKIGDGVSSAVYFLFNKLGNKKDNYICAKWIQSSEPDINIVKFDKEKIGELFIHNCFDAILYFKGINSDILNSIVKVLHKKNLDIPIITTVCQKPSYRSLLLSPFEIKASSHFVFIDKASYSDPLVKFISGEVKSQIYLVSDMAKNLTKSIIYSKKNGEKVIFGRGTTIVKCPQDMFDVFDRIDYKDKEFHIVGVPKEGNWVAAEAKKRDNVVMHGFLDYKSWFDVCKTFDIFLYHLPKECHCSLDANLGLAMWMKIPVVYHGPEAPKERFDHLQNGFVADTTDEIVKYASCLANNYELRKEIGEAGYKSIEAKIGNEQITISKYNSIIEKCISDNKSEVIIPFIYYLVYLKKAWKRIIRDLLGLHREL